MKYTLAGQLSRHLYCWVDTSYTHEEPVGFIPAVWFGLVSYPGRMWGCTVMLESGSVYRNLPTHAISFDREPKGEWTEQEAQTWDCYGWDFTVLEYDFLSGLECKVRANGKDYVGEYLFTVAPIGDGFSAYPEQAKEFAFVKLNNGRLTSQPTNHIVFRERSFTDNKLEFTPGLKRQLTVWKTERPTDLKPKLSSLPLESRADCKDVSTNEI